jgi:hypothetical protein
MSGKRAFLLLAAALTVGACTAAASGARSIGTPIDSSARADRIALVIGGIEQGLREDDAIPVSGALEARIRIIPLANVASARVLQVTLTRGAGSVSDATVKASARMRFMDHGSFQVVAVPSGDGSYVAPLEFAMPGEWALTLAIQTPRESGEIILDLDAFD